jgi:CheY-like chemotaxis protein
MNMPGEVSTATLYRWIEQHRPDLAPRVVFTASNPNGDFADAGRKSGCQVLAKPFAVEEFSRAVQTALASPVPSVSKS